jgi:hypothetical protein
MGYSSLARGLDISTASEHYRSSSASRADINSPGPAYGCPGSTSALPGQHIHPRAGTQLPRAGIYMSRPAYLCPGRHMWARFQLRHFPAGIYLFLAGILACGPE